MLKKINYYRILNLERTAKEEEIKKAYLSLAQKYHPDKNYGNKLAEKKFKQINQAYEILKNPEKRKKLDLLMDKGPRRSPPPAKPVQKKPFSDAFSNIKDKLSTPRIKEEGLDLKVDFPITLEEFCQKKSCEIFYTQPFCGRKRKARLTIQIPEKSSPGTQLLFKNKGGARGKKVFGNLYIKLQLKEHPLFRWKGQNVFLNLPVIFKQALLGTKLKIPSPYGEIQLRLAKGTSDGEVLKLTGMGLPKRPSFHQGDLFVKIALEYPAGEKIKIRNQLKTLSSKELPFFLKKWEIKINDYPRVLKYQLICKTLEQK